MRLLYRHKGEDWRVAHRFAQPGIAEVGLPDAEVCFEHVRAAVSPDADFLLTPIPAPTTTALRYRLTVDGIGAKPARIEVWCNTQAARELAYTATADGEHRFSVDRAGQAFSFGFTFEPPELRGRANVAVSQDSRSPYSLLTKRGTARSLNQTLEITGK